VIPKTIFAVLVVLATVAVSRAAPQSEPRALPNIVLISLDTLRADRLSCYGAKRRTKNIDALAARGVLFANAFSPTGWTLPAHAAMLSGRYPSSIARNPNDRRLFKKAPLLAAMLRDAGYTTAAFTGGIYLSATTGVKNGFDTFQDKWPGDVLRAVRWLHKAEDFPFFLFYHTYVVHIPYKDRRFARGMDGGRLERIYTRDPKQGELHNDICCRAIEVSQEEKDFILALYDGGVAKADQMVGQIISTVSGRGLSDDTIVIVTSDHGEEFWEHTGRGAYHGHTLYDELLRVPLIWYDPQTSPGGQVVHSPVSLVDIVPTLLARVGLEVPPGIDGIDLSAALSGRGWIDRVLFAESIAHGPNRSAVRSPRFKLIETPDPARQLGSGTKFPVPVRAQYELYRADDAAEAVNVVDEHPDIARELGALLQRHSQGPFAPSPARPGVRAKPTTSVEEDPATTVREDPGTKVQEDPATGVRDDPAALFDEDTIRRLRALGYAE
jgi:arylsulfatase A-like enzyme